MAKPDWDRWHDLLDIRDGRGFTDAEQAEYVGFLPIVAKLDAEEARVGEASFKKLSQHAEVNARYPGCTLEYCGVCGEPTGNAGRGEDSNYCDRCDVGPFCWQCSLEHTCDAGDEVKG